MEVCEICEIERICKIRGSCEIEEVCDTCDYCVIKQPHVIFRGYLWCQHPLIKREIKNPKIEECLFWRISIAAYWNSRKQ